MIPSTGILALAAATLLAPQAAADHLALATAYRATAPYLDPHAATAAGYVPDAYCVPGKAGAGGLGYPHFNHAYDDSLDPAKPTALIYVDDARGTRRLAALEWVFTGADRPPNLFGAAFNGPIPGKFPGQPPHYKLRVWLWKENPGGRFALYNPDVSCRPGTTRPAPTPLPGPPVRSPAACSPAVPPGWWTKAPERQESSPCPSAPGKPS
ncbi:hypothetical protein [Streptomyces sp. AP-93]|uniref:hypothetical protein n=1 Tax=Streptomyces sp. AP-93 TaxID=2929048 RepID=UPI001FAFC45C|nr:hypothetical protein [Streptomyces sp. AP-93]MCJ0874053.1 hypothetical protein [Streptomyces sp. AP-93]